MKKLLGLVLLVFLISGSGYSSHSVYGQESAVSFNKLLEEHGSVMMIIDLESGAIEHANNAAAYFYGYSVEELKSMKIEDINTLSPAEVERERRVAAAEERNYFIFEHRLSSGDIRTVEVYSYPYSFGDRTLLFSIIHDITSRIHAEQALEKRTSLFYLGLSLAILMMFIIIVLLIKNVHSRKRLLHDLEQSEKKYKSLFQCMQEGFILLRVIRDVKGLPRDYQIVELNPAFETITGVKYEDAINKSFLTVFPQTEDYKLQKFSQVALTAEPLRYESYPKDIGKYFLVNVFKPDEDRLALVFTDITQHKEREELIRYISFHDDLTGLYNRRFFEEELRRLDVPRNLPISIIVGDVNGLKLANDAFGHMVGGPIAAQDSRSPEKCLPTR